MFESLFQSFDVPAGPEQTATRIAALRAEFLRRGLDGFVVPRADEHQNEYVPPCAERLAWLTGFAGSAGLAIILAETAVIFVDGRYTLQVRDEVDLALVTPQHLVDAPPEQWIEANLRAGQKIGYDPWLQTPGQVERFEKAAAAAGARMVPVGDNLVDAVWLDRPAASHGEVTRHRKRFAGESAAKKLAQINEKFGKYDALVISDPHNLAWAFNLRGQDVAHTPLALGYALLRRNGRATLYMEVGKLTEKLRENLGDLADIAGPAALVGDIETLGAAKTRVRLDAATVPARLAQALAAAGGVLDLGTDPVSLMKAVKNDTELSGTRDAHIRDGAAMVAFLAWFDSAVQSGRLTEIAAAEALETFRRGTKRLKDVSFPTIAGAGANAAIPHYRVNRASNKRIGAGLFLIDSGGQYEDGTTDITRTLAVGKPTTEMRDRFTRVLKGHIAIASAVFPKGTSGAQLDAFARAPLWEAGLDFDHGTGHGVGCYLSVHEGPQRLSKLGTAPLLPGMILSNEPGYYKAGAFGIRIENLIVVESRRVKGAERDMLGFETISLAPIDLRLVELDMLDKHETDWLDAYHAHVRHVLTPMVNASEQAWLKHATQSIGQGAV